MYTAQVIASMSFPLSMVPLVSARVAGGRVAGGWVVEIEYKTYFFVTFVLAFPFLLHFHVLCTVLLP